MPMSQFGTISTVHRAEVRVPEDVFRRFGRTPKYDEVSGRASSYVAASGQSAYDEVIEWGEAPTRQACEDFINFWHNWILLWQGQLRLEPKEDNDD